MTEKQLKQIEEQIPKDEKLSRAYRAFEGDMRIITLDKNNNEQRYTVIFDKNTDNVTIKKF